MPRPISLWAERVHQHYLGKDVGISAAQAVKEFGEPNGITSAAALLNTAAANGYFRRESLKGPGAARLVRYWPLDKALPADRQARTSYFTGLKRVRSVFELGASL